MYLIYVLHRPTSISAYLYIGLPLYRPTSISAYLYIGLPLYRPTSISAYLYDYFKRTTTEQKPVMSLRSV